MRDSVLVSQMAGEQLEILQLRVSGVRVLKVAQEHDTECAGVVPTSVGTSHSDTSSFINPADIINDEVIANICKALLLLM